MYIVVKWCVGISELRSSEVFIPPLASAYGAYAANCGQDINPSSGPPPETCSSYWDVVSTLCSYTCAGSEAYTYTVGGICITGYGCVQAQMELQPYTCNGNCWAALEDINTQCLSNGQTGNNGGYDPQETGTWELGGEWYWTYMTQVNGYSQNGC